MRRPPKPTETKPSASTPTCSYRALVARADSQLNARRSDLKERSAELAATVEAKDKEIAALHAEIASIEHDCDEARAALSDVKAGKKSAGDELSKALAAVCFCLLLHTSFFQKMQCRSVSCVN
jgi:septal ring factor EnvC (AmiA/AmiB activator)